jgi:hypothetical protein
VGRVKVVGFIVSRDMSVIPSVAGTSRYMCYGKCHKLGNVQNCWYIYEIWACTAFQFHYIRLVFLLVFWFL